MQLPDAATMARGFVGAGEVQLASRVVATKRRVRIDGRSEEDEAKETTSATAEIAKSWWFCNGVGHIRRDP